MEIPAPKFEIFETVEPTPDAAIKPAARVGKVEHRAWVEFDQRPGYWRYTVRWPGQGTSSESDEHLQVADRLMCDLRVVVSGAPFKFESWTTESVDVLIERALEKAGVVIRPDEWTLRSSKGVELKHLVGDAELVDGETLLYLDPQVGGGGDEEPTAAEEAGQVWPKGSPERRLIERGGREAVLRDLAAADEAREADAQEAINAVGEALDRIDAPQGATYAERIDRLYRELRDRLAAEEEAKRLLAATIDAQAQLRDNPHLPAEWRKRFEDSLGVPPKGSREREIYDALLHVKVKLADGIAREHTLLDRDSVRLVAAVLEEGLKSSPAGEVRPGTRELRIVLERISHPQALPEFRFIELEDQDGRGVGGFPVREGERNPFYEITIPYARDDGWVSEVAYQVAGAATRPLLEDHPDYVFPAERVRDAVAELLKDFGIARACRPCAEEEIEPGRKEAGDRRDDTIKSLTLRCDSLLAQREQARGGEDHFKAQRDSALHLVRWLIGDIIPPDLIRFADDEEAR